jgi:uncharacterized protein (DUF1499 family)
MAAPAGTWTTRIARATIAAAVLVLLAGPLMKIGLLPWQAGLGMFVVAAILAGLGGLFSLVALVRHRGNLLTVIAAAAGVAGFAVPAAIIAMASSLPPINDITTDPANPPQFIAITAEMRGPEAAPLSYDPAFAAQQVKAYPAVKPLIVRLPPAEVFPKMLAAAKAMDWEIIASDPEAGRIEATATVPWWGFKDDVVVTMRAEGAGTMINVRSKSRVGKGDLGVNAERIKDYLAKITG